jgi:hypothetical protein
MSKRKFKKGDLAVLKSNLNSDFKKGDIVKISNFHWGGNYNIHHFNKKGSKVEGWVSVRYLNAINVDSNNPNINNLEQIIMESVIKDFTSRKEKLQQELQNIEDKLQYINESGCVTFNENEFKVYRTLQLLEKNQTLSRMEKVQALAKLIQ